MKLEKETNNKVNSNKKKERFLSILIVLISIIFFSAIFVGISVVMVYKDSIHSGVYIENIDVGGLSVTEAANKLENRLYNIDNKDKLRLRYKDKVWIFKGHELGIKYDFIKAINEAFIIGRRGTFVDRLATIIELLKHPYNISVRTSLDMDKLNDILNSIEAEINSPCIDASIKRVDGKFIITDESAGLMLEKEKTIDEIINTILNVGYNELAEVDLVVKTIPPKYTSEMLSYITDLLGSHTTKFNSSQKGRSYNIYLSARAIDGTVLMPGEIFSFNKVVGPRSVANGYKTAPVIFKGELVDGIGGGVCQVSSTMYNTVLKSNLGIIERVNHTIPSTYVPKGLDATVVYGVLDFKFQNTTEFPIYIESFTKGNTLTINIYGHKTNNQEVKLISKVDEVISKDTEIIFDSNLPEGKQIIKDKGRNGYKVSAYMIIYENGKEIERKLISKDYYRPSKEVIIKGTKKVTVENENDSNEEKNNAEGELIN